MSTYRILAAASLALALAACSGQQQAEGTAAEPAAGEMPPVAETDTVTPATDPYGADTASTETPPVSTSADASAMGEDTLQPVDPTTGSGDQLQDPMQTDPALEDATSDPQQSATPPPPTQ